MLYVDYKFDLCEDIIIFDEELKLLSKDKPKPWGNLPGNWKDGDLFMLKVTPNGRVALHRKPNDICTTLPS
jgi:hypothetical protein